MSRPRRVRVPGSKNHNLYERADGRLELGYKDSSGKQRWRTLPRGTTITAARVERDSMFGARGRGEAMPLNPRLKFGEAAERWLAEQVAGLRPATRRIYTSHVRKHLLPRWGKRRMNAIDVSDAARLVRELRAEGLAESTIAGVLKAAGRTFKFARRHCGWRGESPIGLLEDGERPRLSETPARRIYQGNELAQVLAASPEPWRTLFVLASVSAGRESELLALTGENLDLSDLDAATIRFTHQLDRYGQRVPLKTEESKATLPLPRSTAAMLLAHKERSTYAGPTAFVFSSRAGTALSARNTLRALHRAQQRARTPQGLPTFMELFEHDDRGNLIVDEKGKYVLRNVPRRELPPLPDFHALRHSAAMECEDAEEARDLLRHRNSNVTRAIYRAHFSDKRREALRARMEARHGNAMEASGRSRPRQTATRPDGEVDDLQEIRGTAQ